LAETTTVNYGWTKPDPGGSPNTWGTTLNATTDKVDAKVYANEQGLAPIGAVTMYAGAAAPANWLLCNGATLLRAAPYDKLFAVLGTAFNVGTVAADSFMLPDLRQKFPIGVGPNALGATGGAFPVTLTTANMPSHTHTATEAAHTHTATQPAHVHPDPGHTHGVTDPGHVHGGTMRQGSGFFALSAQAPLIGASSTDSATTGISIQAAGTGAQAAQPAITVAANTPPAITVVAAGSGTPFNVVPPFVALNYIVRYL
jgi:microcystin-dependent protein